MADKKKFENEVSKHTHDGVEHEHKAGGPHIHDGVVDKEAQAAAKKREKERAAAEPEKATAKKA